MKNKTILLIIALLVIVGIYVIYSSSYEKQDDSNVLKEVFPELNDYCKILEDQAIASNCPTCRFYPFSDGQYFEEVTAEKYSESLPGPGKHYYLISEEEDNLRVDIKMVILYGRTTRGIEAEFSFLTDENGNVLEKDLPDLSCIT